uniref:Uncharacterized protein n=1 Tax=Panagrolaimus sp. ES5 TaxID=591445 RepID=A0AC34FBT7_9BILA
MPAGCKQLSQYRFLAMFRMVDWAQFVYNVQRHVLDGILLLNLFGDDNFLILEFLGPTATVQIWTSFLATLEMLILSLMATFFFRPSKAAFFDKFSDSSQQEIPNRYQKKTVIAPTPSPNPFICHPALDATITDEPEQFSPKILAEKQSSKIVEEKKASQEKSPKLVITSLIDGEKIKPNEHERQHQQKLPQLQSQPPPPPPLLQQQERQQISPNGNDKTKTPLTVTATTNTPLHTSLIDPNSTTNVEILQVEPTQEPTDKIS